MQASIWPWNDRTGRFSLLRFSVFVALVAPLLWIVLQAFAHGLGPRPTTESIHQTGLWAIRFLAVTLAITPLRNATRFARLAAIRRMVGLAVLFSFNGFSIALGLASLAIVAVYPLMKRVTSWPQAVLGLAFSWGALMGWAASYGALAPPALLLYASAFCWTIGYDTIYALQDARDDAIVGIKSTARLFGAHARLGVGLFYLLTALLAQGALLWVGAGFVAEIGWAAYCAHLVWQVSQVDGASPATALKLFRSNRDAGLILFLGIALEGWLRGAMA